MWIRVSLSSLLSSIHVLWGAAFRCRVPKSAIFSTFETSLPQLPSCYWATTPEWPPYILHCLPHPRDPRISVLFYRNRWDRYIAGSSPEFNPCFKVIGVSIGGKKTKQQLLDFRIFFFFLKPWSCCGNATTKLWMRPRSGRQWWSSPNLHPNLQLADNSFIRGSREIQPATSASSSPPLEFFFFFSSAAVIHQNQHFSQWVSELHEWSQLFTLTTTTSTDKVSGPKMDTFISAPVSPRIINTCLELLDN